MPLSKDNSDELLQFDAAAVAIQARNNAEKLAQVQTFANELLRYTGMMMEQPGAAATAPAAPEPEETVALEVTEVKAEERGATIKQQEEEESQTILAPDPDNTAAASTDDDAPVAHAGRKRQATNDNEHSKHCSKRLKDIEHVQVLDDEGTNKLVKSAGRPKKSLNLYLKHLGLTSKLSNTAISRRGEIISHIVLDETMIVLPDTTTETLEFWIPESQSKSSSLLDPSTHEQHHTGIPVFWSRISVSVEEICHYIGHFQCIRFEKQARNARDRTQHGAMLEFAFVDYDDDLSQKMPLVPFNVVPMRKQPRRS